MLCHHITECVNAPVGLCYDFIAPWIISLTIVFTSTLADAMRSMDVSRSPDSLISYSRVPVSRATGSCTHTFPFPFHVFSYVYQYGLLTCLRLLVCVPFLLLFCRLVRLRFSLMPFSFRLVDSSLCLPLLLMTFLL